MTALSLAQSALNHAIALTPILFIGFVIARELVKAAQPVPTPRVAAPPAAPAAIAAPVVPVAQPEPEPAPTVAAPMPQPLPKTVAAMRKRAQAMGMPGAARAKRAQLLAFLG